jgi:hypothetical protein
MRIEPICDVMRDQLQNLSLAVAGMDPFFAKLSFLLVAQPAWSGAILLSEFRREPETKVEERISPIRMGLRGAVLFCVREVRLADLQHRPVAVFHGWLSVQSQPGVGIEHVLYVAVGIFDMLTIFVAQWSELRTLGDVPTSAFTVEETPVMSALLASYSAF